MRLWGLLVAAAVSVVGCQGEPVDGGTGGGAGGGGTAGGGAASLEPNTLSGELAFDVRSVRPGAYLNGGAGVALMFYDVPFGCTGFSLPDGGVPATFRGLTVSFYTDQMDGGLARRGQYAIPSGTTPAECTPFGSTPPQSQSVCVFGRLTQTEVFSDGGIRFTNLDASYAMTGGATLGRFEVTKDTSSRITSAQASGHFDVRFRLGDGGMSRLLGSFDAGCSY